MAWELLFGSDIGLMSLGVIVGVLVIGVIMGKLYSSKVEEESAVSASKFICHFALMGGLFPRAGFLPGDFVFGNKKTI